MKHPYFTTPADDQREAARERLEAWAQAVNAMPRVTPVGKGRILPSLK